MEAVKTTACVISVVCWVALVAAQQPTGHIFYRQVTAELLKHAPIVSASETVVTFNEETSVERPMPVQVQFPSIMAGQCPVKVSYIETGHASLSEQVAALRGRQPNISVQEAVLLIRVASDVRDVPCDSSLARLLRRGSELSIRLLGQHPNRVYVDVPFYEVQVHGGAEMRVTATLAALSEDPVARWLDEVREAIVKYATAGFRAP